MDKKKPPESVLEKGHLAYVDYASRSDRSVMVELIDRLYQEAHTEEGMSLASQRYITRLLRDAARLADDPGNREARNNPLARTLKLSAKRKKTGFEVETAKMLHMFARKHANPRGAVAHAISELYSQFPEVEDHYSESMLRKIYEKYDHTMLDILLMQDCPETGNK